MSTVALELGAGSQALSSDSRPHTHTYSVQANVILVVQTMLFRCRE